MRIASAVHVHVGEHWSASFADVLVLLMWCNETVMLWCSDYEKVVVQLMSWTCREDRGRLPLFWLIGEGASVVGVYLPTRCAWNWRVDWHWGTASWEHYLITWTSLSYDMDDLSLLTLLFIVDGNFYYLFAGTSTHHGGSTENFVLLYFAEIWKIYPVCITSEFQLVNWNAVEKVLLWISSLVILDVVSKDFHWSLHGVTHGRSDF